ncbi:MAG TPA: peptidylprolyl isomerase [Anaerolineales bacterium]|nr:peptidylprolyl isomerase [Anaerolineales bacterium]
MPIKRLFAFVLLLCPFLILASCAIPQINATATGTHAPTYVPIPTPPAANAGCSTIEAEPTANISSGLPPITSADYVRGPDHAAVTMILYCDFQSTQCQSFGNVVDQLQDNHPDDLRVVYRPLPAIGILDKSQISTQAVLAAGDQGKFWAMRDLLHSRYNDWADLTVPQFNAWIKSQAGSIGLDAAQFEADYQDPETATRAKSMHDVAVQLGIGSIPVVFINGSLQQAAILDYNSVNDVVSMTALGAREFRSCPSFTIDASKQYVATLHTEKGGIVVQLYADKAPLAVNSFVFLAKQGWFNGVTFHRVIPGFLAQAGDPSGTGKGGPGYFFKNETSDLKFDRPGVVGMANSGPDTNGSQFFITYAPLPNLDESYTIFGQVIQGMDVVEDLTPRDPSQAGDLPPGDKILSVSIQEK